ncbi:MAG: hypothetical protein JWN39_3257 [Ilumatobacteraceae bacterium]|nr:hypothetical protein [Ilumatobacteraceae bacterium]
MATTLTRSRRIITRLSATAAHTYDALDIEVLSVADAVPMTIAEPVPVVGGDADLVGSHVVHREVVGSDVLGTDVVAAAVVSSGTEPTPAPRSTDGSSPTEP